MEDEIRNLDAEIDFLKKRSDLFSRWMNNYSTEIYRLQKKVDEYEARISVLENKIERLKGDENEK